MIITSRTTEDTPTTDTDNPNHHNQQANQQQPAACFEASPALTDVEDASCNLTVAADQCHEHQVAPRTDDDASYNADDDATVELSKEDAQRLEQQQQQQQVVPLKKPPQITTTSNSNTKRRSSWRHLLSPSYKSRSDEFHKFFANEIPKGERLIADYSCALHREFLIQGRLYVSINYLAFYSNLFSWITKLVVRLRDIRDIYKANTAKIIPNAIQIVTHTNEKHVFASFIARDKSYMLIWRIWRNNNLLKERLSDAELRKLVHLGYGKDLGLNDAEESKISAAPLPRTPANQLVDGATSDGQQDHDGAFQHSELQNKVSALLDRNNNSEYQGAVVAAGKRSRYKSRSQNQKDLIMLIDDESTSTTTNKLQQQQQGKQLAIKHKPPKRGHARFSSVDYGNIYGSRPQASSQVDVMLGELSNKLAVLPASPAAQNQSDKRAAVASCDLLLNQTCSPASSVVIVDTPASIRMRRSQEQDEHENDEKAAGSHCQRQHVEEATEEQIFAPGLAEGQQQLGTSAETTTTITEERIAEHTARRPTANDDATSTTTAASSNPKQLVSERSVSNSAVEGAATSTSDKVVQSLESQRISPTQEAAAGSTTTTKFDAMGQPLNTKCDCDSHEGLLVADEELDINIDILFSLIFTNSKFMRAYMLQRGQNDLVVGKWRRPAGHSAGGDRSNSSTLSSRDGEEFQQQQQRKRQNSIGSFARQQQQQDSNKKAFKTKQVRQLNYSMNVNHVLSKQVQVEEKQNICQVKPGVYVLESQAMNSGFPCSESFTIDLKYCLTRTSHINKSRLVVHGLVNFLKEKQNWRLAMVKPIIEKQSVQGIVEFITDLIESIKKFIETKKQQNDPTVYTADSESSAGRNIPENSSGCGDGVSQQLAQSQADSSRQQQQQRSRSSLVRAKSKLKERKLRNMYKYYIQAATASGVGGSRQQGGNNDSAHDDDDDQSISGTSGSDMSCSMSSICDMNDDESMIMMMTHHTIGSNYNNNGTTQNQQRRRANYYGMSHDSDDDNSDEDFLARSSTGGGFPLNRRSFSDLEDGPIGGLVSAINQDSSDPEEYEGHSRYRRRRGRMQRHNGAARDSEASNATLNNDDQDGGAWHQRRPVFGAAGRHRHNRNQEDSRRPSSKIAIHSDDDQEEDGNLPPVDSARGSHEFQRQRSKPPAGHHYKQAGRQQQGHRGTSHSAANPPGRLFQRRDSTEEHQKHHQKQSAAALPPSRILNRLFSTRNLVSLMLISLLLLVFAMIMSHAIILRRLARVEQLLKENCSPPLSSSSSQP